MASQLEKFCTPWSLKAGLDLPKQKWVLGERLSFTLLHEQVSKVSIYAWYVSHKSGEMLKRGWNRTLYRPHYLVLVSTHLSIFIRGKDRRQTVEVPGTLTSGALMPPSVFFRKRVLRLSVWAVSQLKGQNCKLMPSISWGITWIASCLRALLF